MRFARAYDRVVSSYRSQSGYSCRDIGAGGREIGYMFGQYKRLKTNLQVFLPEKESLGWLDDSPRSHGYGAVYFAENMLSTKSDGSRQKSSDFWLGECGAIRCRKMHSAGCQGAHSFRFFGYVMDPDGSIPINWLLGWV